MIIDALYTYPIKSLLPIRLSSTRITLKGPRYDRVFLLQRAHRNAGGPENPQIVRWENMLISIYNELCLFQPRFSPSEENPHEVVVRYLGENAVDEREIAIPLQWDIVRDGLERTEVDMHKSPCDGWVLGRRFGEFFSKAFGYEVRLVWLGNGEGRKVLGSVVPGSEVPQVDQQPERTWLGKLSNTVFGSNGDGEDWRIGFADCAPLLITTMLSLKEVEDRIGISDMQRFRPNIVLALEDGEKGEAWEEDYWSCLKLGDGVEAELTANCARCKSINVDFANGKQLPPSQQPFKALMKDRRVDLGKKYLPVFGRYGFISRKSFGTSGEVEIKVGDNVSVLKRNNERTVFYWPGL